MTAPDPGPPARPRWVKVTVIVAVVVVVVGIIIGILVGGEHGPGRHRSSGGGPEAPTASVQHRA